jgi:ankyrin repeat protein
LGLTPLHAAAAAGAVQLVLRLLSSGAPVARADDKGDTPLHVAARRGDTAYVTHAELSSSLVVVVVPYTVLISR